jgi:hypothetical protein
MTTSSPDATLGDLWLALTDARAEIERLKAGWQSAFDIGVSEQEQNKKLRAKIERLRAGIHDAIEALERNSTSAPVLEALRALEHKP